MTLASEQYVLKPTDDSWHHHEVSDHPWWNEPALFCFAVPEKKINGIVYYWHRPNQKLTATTVAMWDGRGEEQHDILYHEWYAFNPYPADGDQFDFTLQNGLSVQSLEPLNKYRVKYETSMCQLDLTYTGTHPAQALSYQAQSDRGEDGSADPHKFSEWGSFHYEQLCHIEGLVVVDGERYPVDCHHWRDRSWGVRPPINEVPGAGLDVGWATNGTAFVSTMIPDQYVSEITDDIEYPHCYGQVAKDGVTAKLTKGTRSVPKRGADGRPLHVILDLEDALGRKTHAVGTPQSFFRYDNLYYAWWCYTEWEIDGCPGYGETEDSVPSNTYRRHQRKRFLNEERVTR